MNTFSFTRAKDTAHAVTTADAEVTARYLAGGTNLIDLMKVNIERPTRLVDIHRLPLDQIEKTRAGLHVGAMARNSDTASHPLVREHCPLLAQALLSGASPQLRNMATVGGNLMQRTRCWYFYDAALPCNKRQPGSGCGAIEGVNRIHAIFGASEQCIAVHPSDMCVALAALDAIVEVEGKEGPRSIAIDEFHRLPGTTPHVDTNLQHGELITGIILPSKLFTRHAHYLKVRDRTSYDFALVSVAAALVLEGRKIVTARIALGGVAHKPWRALSAEKLLEGAKADETLFAQAAAEAVRDAKPHHHNAFKVDLARRAIARALALALERKSTI